MSQVKESQLSGSTCDDLNGMVWAGGMAEVVA
jgi:hypothetical protein